VAIEGVHVKPLRVIPDERGRLMEILRCDDEVFDKFGQVYLTTVRPGVVKAWHYHKVQSDNMTCVKGMLKLALYDGRDGSSTQGELMEFFIGDHNCALVHIPAGVYHGFKGIGAGETLVVNCVTEPYDRQAPDEHRVDPHENDIPYDWARKDG
jgi:dTDP-4-dehydrorhamnose 3,5-epimerase